MTRGATVTAEYLAGIAEGRSYLRRFRPTPDEMRDVLRNTVETLRGFRSGPVADLLRGERDFWRSQLKKLEN